MGGGGFDAHGGADLPPGLKRWLGKCAYVTESLRQLVQYKVPRYRLTSDGRYYDGASAVIAKGHFYGGKFVCAPDARLDAPDFQVCLFGMGGRLGALRATAALTTGLLQYLPEITLVRGRQVTVATLGDSAYADGEPVQADRKSTRLNSSH